MFRQWTNQFRFFFFFCTMSWATFDASCNSWTHFTSWSGAGAVSSSAFRFFAEVAGAVEEGAYDETHCIMKNNQGATGSRFQWKNSRSQNEFSHLLHWRLGTRRGGSHLVHWRLGTRRGDSRGDSRIRVFLRWGFPLSGSSRWCLEQKSHGRDGNETNPWRNRMGETAMKKIH